MYSKVSSGPSFGSACFNVDSHTNPIVYLCIYLRMFDVGCSLHRRIKVCQTEVGTVVNAHYCIWKVTENLRKINDGKLFASNIYQTKIILINFSILTLIISIACLWGWLTSLWFFCWYILLLLLHVLLS